ncbi:MAG TPA: HAD family hydrolase [Planctomycetota bacterium]|nr:HAD family hydrolase [Planctomycetota bacterium]
MKYSAVIFDLFGTLVATFSSRKYKNLLCSMAAAVGASPDHFSRLWLETCNDRWSGAFATTEANIEHICHKLGLAAAPQSIAEAARVRLPVVEESMQPREDAADTLKRLRTAGCRIGLISDCSMEVPLHWPCTPFAPLVDVPIFSCTAGIRKPDPRIYRLACERLGVAPPQCIYVGDGGSRELSGASAVGMHPVLIRVPHENNDAHRIEAEEWQGTRISKLSEVLAVAGLPGQ